MQQVVGVQIIEETHSLAEYNRTSTNLKFNPSDKLAFSDL